jgi:enterochelin esterase family protein
VTLKIQQLLAGGPPGAAAIDAFVAANRFPIVEGTRVTFVYRGEADGVSLRHFIYGLPSSQPLERVNGTDLWYRVLELPEGSRVEYKLDLVQGGVRQWIMDPLNPLVAHDPFGANSVCQAAGYETPEWAREDPEARPGSLHELSLPSAALSGTRRVTVYLPARFRRQRRYPLLIVHDGGHYLEFASLKTVLDNLIHRLDVPPLVAALTHPEDRLREYAAHPAHAEFLTRELVPVLERSYPLIPRSSARGLLGASFGAVASLFTAWSHPGFYGRLLLQSGSFAFTDIGPHHRGPAFDPVVAWVNRFREGPGRPSDKVFVSCGIYESLIYENRSIVPLLERTGMEVRFVEARDGHNWENWRDRLREGLSWLFAGPLWMVYE